MSMIWMMKFKHHTSDFTNRNKLHIHQALYFKIFVILDNF